MTTMNAVDLYAGPGGWDVAAHALGMPVLGYELDDDAVATRGANGLLTRQVDLLTSEHLWPENVYLLIGSPPCPGFSKAGKGKGRDDAIDLPSAIRKVHGVSDLHDLLHATERDATDARTVHVLIPLLWALSTLPESIVLEQVPPVLPVWEACADVLRRFGYDAATGLVDSERYGVPQTRRRAVLLAKRYGAVEIPEGDFSRYHARTVSRIDEGKKHWISMAQACGWDLDDVVGFLRRDDGRDEGLVLDGIRYRARDLRTADMPSFALTSKSRSWRRFSDWDRRVNNQTGTDFDLVDQVSQPATTVAGRQLVGFRGANANRFNGRTKSRNDGINVTTAEAAALQTFPEGYIFEGTQTSQYQQIGNAVPPRMAHALLKAVL